MPVTVTEAEVERVRASLGELPAALRTRLEQTYGITPYDSDVLVNQGRPLVDYYIELADACGDGKAASNWVQQDVLRWLGEQQVDDRPVSRSPRGTGRADRQGARRGLRDQPRPRGAGRDGRLGQVAGRGHRTPWASKQVDDSALVELCRKLVEANPKIAAEVKEGKLKGLGALIGQAKKENPNVNPNRVRELCLEMIQGASVNAICCNTMSIITLTTDFGTGSHYVAAMKGVILSIHPAATIVDIAHDVPPQDIRRAALLLDDVADWFPPETIHVAVVDPGVGTDRAIVYARIGQQQFIAPDNGLLSRLAARTPPAETHPPGRAGLLAEERLDDVPRPRHHGPGGGPAGPGARPRAAWPAAGSA